MSFPLPINESLRVETLRRLQIMGTPPEGIFERVTELAKLSFGVESAFVSFVDESRQWFKSYRGCPGPDEAPRESAFCAHTILGNHAFVVTNAAEDSRFQNNPLVKTSRGIRFYAGVPLVVGDGLAVGTLGISDPAPRAFTEKEIGVLRGLSSILVDHLQTRLDNGAKTSPPPEALERAIIDCAPDGIVSIDAGGQIVEFNPAAEKTLGFERAHVIGRPLAELIIPERYRALHEEGMKRFQQTGDSRLAGKAVELYALHADGREIPVELRISKMKLGEIEGFTAHIRDLTDGRQSEERRRREQRMEAVAQLTGGIAHDFNNLLGIIIGNLGLLERRCASDERALALTGTALRAARRGSDFTRQLLSLSKKSDANTLPADVNDVLAGMSTLLTRELGGEIKIESSLEEEVWLTEIDPGELEEVVLNIALNARDAMPDGGRLVLETINYRVTGVQGSKPTLAAGEYVVISIGDTGCGMPPELAQKIFDPFFTTKPKGHGIGLGLSVVYGFVNRAGGYIRVYSEVDVGTTIRLYLPRSESDDESWIEPPDSLKRWRGSGERILVVEDDPDMREVARSMLEDLGYRTLGAATPKEALSILDRGEPVDLLFSDVVMPGSMNGVELVDSARARRSKLKVLLTSGFSGNAALGGDKVVTLSNLLPKPYDQSELAQSVWRTLNDNGATGSRSG